MAKNENGTVLDAVVAALTRASEFNRDDMVAPAAVLWPDKESLWLSLAPKLREALPQFLTLGEYDAGTRTGPAIWIRCMLARTLPEANWPADAVPIIYLPGVSKQELRAVEDCPPALQPLAELQYRGVVWTQVNGRDWTISAFLQSEDGGLGLDVARDNATVEAMRRALPKLADEQIAHLRGRRLEAPDFNEMLSPDPGRDLLTWLNDPAGTKEAWDAGRWDAFRSTCRDKYSFDPHKEGELGAAEALGTHHDSGAWVHVWRRYAEAPHLYPNLKNLLRRAKPAGNLFAEPSPAWPQDNEDQESDLRAALMQTGKMTLAEAIDAVTVLEAKHAERRWWVWASMGEAPLARAIEHLGRMAEAVGMPMGGPTAEAMAEQYAAGAWRADAAVLDALASVRDNQDVEALEEAIGAIYKPWLESAAQQFQKLVMDAGATALPMPARLKINKGCCVLFADGLRFDVGQKLVEQLGQRALAVEMTPTWSALPPVTPTAKPAISPIAHLLSEQSTGEEFRPTITGKGKDLTPDRFKELLADSDVQVLDIGDTGNPAGRGWTEFGTLDRRGHEEGWKLSWRIDEEIRGLLTRVQQLLDAGWQEVRIVTDHGWLLLPGGLPKVDMPKYLTETRWGRCAMLDQMATAEVPAIGWSWNPGVRVAVAPGISAFKGGLEFAHGSLTLQECLVPMLSVRLEAGATRTVSIESVNWRKLVCRVSAKGVDTGWCADLRAKPADAGSSLLVDREPRAIAPDGSVTLYADDVHEGAAAVVVVLNDKGKPVVKQSTVIGGEG